MTEKFNNKGEIDYFVCFCAGLIILITIFIGLLIYGCEHVNRVNIYDHGREAAHIEVDKNLAFDGYEWIDGDLILHYKEK